MIFSLNSICVCSAQNNKDNQEDSESEYQISQDDLLEISVYEERDLSKTVRVDADGKINYPFLGNVSVVGLTATELGAKLTELLSRDYLINPQVTVFVREHAKISVLGQVQRPGTYELQTGLTVMDAISLAGGFTGQANSDDIKLVRIKKGEEKETININANDIITKKEEDVILKSGDLLVVGGLSEASNFVTILGQVKRPGRYNWKKSMTAIDAIAMANGLTDIAAANGTKIIREKEGKKQVFIVPVGSILQGTRKSRDIPLEPDDIIVVPESFF